MLKTIRGQLTVAFFLVALVAGSTGGWGLYLHNKARALSALATDMDAILLQSMEMILLEQDFFRYDCINPEFYATQSSKRLEGHQLIVDDFAQSLLELQQGERFAGIGGSGLDIDSLLAATSQMLEEYQATFDRLVQLYLRRGFKDSGLEGQMRGKIHRLEELHPGISTEDILMLRRHEKDYIIRKDSQYLNKLEALSLQLESTLAQKHDTEEHARVIRLLSEYRKDFRVLFELETEMGLNTTGGLLARNTRVSRQLAQNLSQLGEQIHARVASQNHNYNRLTIFAGLGSVLLSLLLGIFLSRGITRPIRRLTRTVQQAVKGNFAHPITLPTASYAREITQLSADFDHMYHEIQNRLREIRQQASTMETQNKVLKALNAQLTESEKSLFQSNDVKDKILAIVSHDLRSPLSSMQGYLSVLEVQAGSFSPEQTIEFAAALRGKVGRVVELLNNLLRWAMLQAGELEFNPVQVSLLEIAERNRELYEDIALAKEIRLIHERKEAVYALADEVMLDFVLRNLISNAIKFSPADTEIRISYHKMGDEVNIFVRDQGIGMNAEQIGRLLDRRQHYSTSGTNKESGTGLGMTLVLDFLEKQNGRLGIESTPGKGTAVRVTMPAAAPSEA